MILCFSVALGLAWC